MGGDPLPPLEIRVKNSGSKAREEITQLLIPVQDPAYVGSRLLGHTVLVSFQGDIFKLSQIILPLYII